MRMVESVSLANSAIVLLSHDEYAPTEWRWLLPWRSRRTVPFDEMKFRRALDEFASAEMRLGK